MGLKWGNQSPGDVRHNGSLPNANDNEVLIKERGAKNRNLPPGNSKHRMGSSVNYVDIRESRQLYLKRRVSKDE